MTKFNSKKTRSKPTNHKSAKQDHFVRSSPVRPTYPARLGLVYFNYFRNYTYRFSFKIILKPVKRDSKPNLQILYIYFFT